MLWFWVKINLLWPNPKGRFAPEEMEEVKEALIAISGMTITGIRGHGRQQGHKEVYRGQDFNVD